jgi:hypothetical protein
MCMRSDEERCKDAFNVFLEQRYQERDITWVGGDRNKPPDYYLKLCANQYAVEVTSILETVTLGSAAIPHIAVDKSVKEFIDDIQKDLISKGFLNGAYIVHYKPLSDFGKQKQIISIRIKDYIQSTQNVLFAPAEDIIGHGHFRWYIYKLHSDKNYLSRTTTDAKFESEAVDELCKLLNKTLEAKTKKLKAILLPKILLLHDRFAWIDVAQWRQYMSKLNYLDNFHTIFLVSEKSRDSILRSIETSWLN